MKKIEIILLHIKQDASEIQDFIQGLDRESFVTNLLVRKAVCMSLINIGELVKTLPNEFRDNNPEIPWKRIAGLSDLAAHKYHQLDWEAVWNVAINRIPELIDFINLFLKNSYAKTTNFHFMSCMICTDDFAGIDKMAPTCRGNICIICSEF